MSQFDFPRINFSGEATINPPTGNNNTFFPLVLFDPVKVKAVMPPRIYLSEKLMRIHSLGLFILPDDTLILNDEDAFYFEINTINSQEVFKQWATTPLGKSHFDTEFHSLYTLIRTARDNEPLLGKTPCHWNYYGGMDFGFNNVSVISIEVPNDGKGGIYTFYQNENCPPDFEQIIGSSVEFKDNKDKSVAVMVNVNTSMPYYSQIFSDSLIISKNGKTFIKGKPCKASSRFLNLGRIVNQEGATAGSGTFYCVIPIFDLEEGVHSPVIKFFKNHILSSKTIKGVFIRFNLFEVKEDEHPAYDHLHNAANPARCSVVGSVTPWYENDLKSITMGRQLVPVCPYLGNIVLPPFVMQLDSDRKVIYLDLISSIPETFSEGFYQTYDLGEMSVKCRIDDNTEIDIGNVTVNCQHLNRDKMISAGGVIAFNYSENALLKNAELENGLFLIYGISKKDIHDKGSKVLLMQESEFMVSSDEPGLYLNQHDHPTRGYTCYSHERAPCKITIFQKGKPFDGTVSMTIKEIKLKSVGSLPSINTFVENKEFQNNQALEFPSHEAANILYVFYPNNSDTSMNLNEYILNTGFFISLRVLPKHDYSKFLDKNHPQYSTPIPFDFIYEEILKVYDLVYPASSIITPFNEEYFKQGWRFIKRRLSPDNWDSASYMPSSRDMSFDQWELICKWEENLE
jgi:hypothetical protein